ncbi:DNA adenine methylase [Moraxella sp. ZJ142]|uniref:DNA adenine methylase n=1 Tax=Moraxella marmotae TaxID=3344520 RepID=UPI0035D446B7
MKVVIPPIKSQGIKTKLVPSIASHIPKNFNGTWIEPFMGTGVVGFNLAPNKAIFCDTNPHLIQFYQQIINKQITSKIAREFLSDEGFLLLEKGEQHYYDIRERFNRFHNPLDFLFINRAGFNGMIRFNKKGEFNIPFCRKPQRFAQSYITKIVNQIERISEIFAIKDFQFICQTFEKTVDMASENDLIYCDPPYIDRHTDYYNQWQEKDEFKLHELLKTTPAYFILSTWHHNIYRKNQYIDTLWGEFNISTQEHFYHIGAKEANRNTMMEAIICNFNELDSSITRNKINVLEKQLVLL